VRREWSIAAVTVAFIVGAGGFPGADAWAAKPVGTVVSAKKLPKRLWIPGTTAKAWKLTYLTTNGRGKRARSTGTVFLPKGRAPKGGWPVISWAHGTSGLADACAPSRVGPALPERDRPYLAKWMREGYAIVASDYAGLGTPGVAAYLHGRSEAHNIVDIVKAGRAYTGKLARKWVVVGQSQGAGAAIYTARWATKYGGRGLDYRGAVGTGTPAYIEKVVETIEPGDLEITPGTAAYFGYILAGLRWSHPELGLSGALTESGLKYVRLAETQCVFDYEKSLEGVNFGQWFSKALAGLPNFTRTLSDYMAMPEKGFDKPFFMGHGTKDTDVPYGLTAAYVRTLKANKQPVRFKSYESDHSGTLIASQKDTKPFVRKLFSAKPR
jgi:pimeloyl-ACP methyl ester carboxylesterase